MAARRSMAKLALADADDTRYLFSALTVADSAGVPRSGVTSPVGTNLVTSSATMNVSVARFQGVAVRDAGALLVANDGPTNVLIGAAPASNSRLDVIYIKQNDASSTVTTPDANNTPVFGVLVGVASATPVRNPAGLPAGALELATILVPSTATATNSAGVVITQTAQFTAAAGGAVPFRTFAQMKLWTAAAPEQLASVVADSANNGLYAWNGSSWQTADGDVFLSCTRAVAGTMGANSVFYIGVGSGTAASGTNPVLLPFWGVPVSDTPLDLAGSVYSNGIFSWDVATGQLKVLVAGTYEIEYSVAASPLGSGFAIAAITKNTTTVDSTTVARDDRQLNGSVATYLKARHPAVALVTADILRFETYIISAAGAVTLGANATDGTFRIRKVSA